MALPGRLSIMLLRCIISFPLEMPFLNMNKATCIMLNSFFAITGVLLSISICFRLFFRILEREREKMEWDGLKRKRGQGGIYIYMCVCVCVIVVGKGGDEKCVGFAFESTYPRI